MSADSCNQVQPSYQSRWLDLWTGRFSGFYYQKDSSGRLVFVSPEASQVLGWPCEEILRQWSQWMEQDPSRRMIPPSFSMAQEGAHVEVVLVRVPDAEGRSRQLELMERPQGAEAGPGRGFEGLAIDVSGARDRESRYRELLDFSPIGIFQVDAESQFVYVNTYWQVITRFTLKETLGQPWWKPIHPEDRERIFHEWDLGMKERREFFTQCRILRPDGEVRWVELRSRFLFHDEGSLTFGTLEDIHDRKMMEGKLEDYARELVRSNSDLEQFAAIASHDLQEPLRKIITFGDRLRTSFASRDEVRAGEYLNRIQTATRRMQKFIQDLLHLSRVASQAAPFEAVDLQALVSEVISDLEDRVQKTGATITCESLPTLHADPLQMRQLIQNLLSNAIKFHRPGVPPEVFVTARGPESGRWELIVQDNGVGFEEEHLERIFKPFERLRGRSEYEGSGIGLAVCKKIVERHGGCLTARSEPGVGTRFIVNLPEMGRPAALTGM